MARTAIWLALGVVAVGAFWVSLTDSGPTRPPAEPPAPLAAAPQLPPVPAPAVVAPLPTPESTGIPAADCIAYPDGTRLPPLNGVKKAPAITFHRLLPFAPIVRKEFDRATGLEWYIHANGAWSTTRLMQDGRAVAEVTMPAKSQPVVDDK